MDCDTTSSLLETIKAIFESAGKDKAEGTVGGLRALLTDRDKLLMTVGGATALATRIYTTSELICDIDDAFDDVNENPDDHCWEVGFKINMLVLDVDIAMDVNEEHI
ncbi:hypothetical protein JHK87_004358 [Glycine soja]|nr:hypothetical protein JHK87_004358 [Glycine soja]